MHCFLQFSFACALVLATTQANACLRLSEPDAIAHGRADRDEWMQLVEVATRDADLIIIARVLDLTVDERTEVDADRGLRIAVTRTHPTLEHIETLKGTYAPNLHLYWDDDGSVVVSCGTSHWFNEIDLSETYRYLIFAKAGRIQHASLINDWPSGPLSTMEQIDIARRQ